ncbi:hypothetical protein BBJ28_00015469 [Nothophytophthora sp. Chile5]|nr:hypothetical protein BBJ28_00015469 [Nothophytophthora sp. Chile5]
MGVKRSFMASSVADAIAALKRGDAAPLAKAMAQRKLQRRAPGGNGKRKVKGKSKSKETEDEEEGEEDEADGGDKPKKALAQLDDEVRALPRETLDAFYPAAVKLVAPSGDESEEATRLKARECIAEFTVVLVETKGVSIDKEELFAVAQELHDQLVRLRGDANQVLATQEAISLLCESCWKHNFCGRAHSLVTQLLPYLIVRSYESAPTGNFNSKKHPIRRLFAIKDALPLLDFDDDSSGLLRDILLRCFIQPTFFRSPDAIAFLSFLFTLHVPFVEDINETIRNQIPNQRSSILKKYGSIYFKVRPLDVNLTESVVTKVLNCPILWRGVKAPNDSVRRQATILLFDNFPLRDPAFNNALMDLTLQKQFDTFEELLGDSHPALRVAAIEGVSKVLSVYWELLPAETIRCFLSKLVVDLVNDVSSSSVRAAVFEGVQFILDNHNSHSILKPLLPMLAPLINDRNERVRAEFGALLVRIKSIRNLHFYDVVPVNDLLCRMVMDRDSPMACKQLVSLFLNSYFPQSVGGSSQVARCLALVKKNPEAAMVFYANVVEHVSVGSCKTFLREQLNVESLEALLLAYSEDRPYDQEALSSIWKIVGYLGELSEGALLERLVENFMRMNENSSKKLLESMVDCLVQWDQLPLLVSKLVKFLGQWKKNKFHALVDSTTSKKKGKKTTIAALNPVVVLGTVEYIIQLPSVKGLTSLLAPLVAVLESCVEPILEFDADEVEEVYKANSFGFMRLLEVYAKVAVMAECARVNDETSLLVEKSAKQLSKKDELRDLQPSEFFTPPKSLSALFAWVARLLLDFRKEIEASEQSKHAKKRRRGKNADAADQLSPQQELLSRWRNLFSLVSMLSAESVAFALERTHWLQNGPAADFVDSYVDTLCDTLRDMEPFERTVFYQSGQLLHLLGGVRAKASRTSKAQAVNLVPSLEHWTSTLQTALEGVHEKSHDKCDDLWPAVSASFSEQCAVAAPEEQTVA